MGCGCGRRKGIRVNVNQNKSNQINGSQAKSSITLNCQKCSRPMLLKQQYFPAKKKYVKIWQCSKCGYKIVGK